MTSKRVLLWDWTLTRDFPQAPAIQETADSLREDGLITTVINWNSWRPTELPPFMRFRPMVRTLDQLEGNEWNMINDNLSTESKRPGGSEVMLLGFNEPERVALSSAQAADLWTAKIVPLKEKYGSNLKLVSPACASDPSGTQWLERFMEILDRAQKPDYIGAHFYTNQLQPVDQEIAAAKAYLLDLHSKYGLPLSVSEIASTSRDAADVEKFSRELAKWMDEQGWIREYAFFGVMREVADGFVSPAAQLLDSEGHWTPLGRWWAGV